VVVLDAVPHAHTFEAPTDLSFHASPWGRRIRGSTAAPVTGFRIGCIWSSRSTPAFTTLLTPSSFPWDGTNLGL
jgi:hypothetical protein